jgi:glutathione peroxidase
LQARDDVALDLVNGQTVNHQGAQDSGLASLGKTKPASTRRFVVLSDACSTFDKLPVRISLIFMKTIALLFAFSLMTNLAVRAASIYDIPVKNIDGNPTTLGAYKGKVLLIVNVASRCGFTPQYTALEATYKKYSDQGFVILGFPCNQFGGQEPGSDAEIKQFCTSKFAVTFPMFDKIEVNGAGRHPLYVQLAGDTSPYPGNIGWNFTKFLIGKDGQILKRFDSKTKPDSPEVVAAIEAALAAK